MKLSPGDILRMKKPHPCGRARWEVLRIGADLRLRCLGCGHELLLTRAKAERAVRAVENLFDESAKKSAENSDGK